MTKRNAERWLLGLLAAVALTGAGYGAAAMAVTGRASSSVSMTETASTNFPTVTLSASPTFGIDVVYGSGTGVNLITKKWCDRRTIAASGADTLDFAGVLTNEYGVAQTFATVKVLTVKADSTNTNNVWIGGGANNRFNTFLKDSSVFVVQPGFQMSLIGRTTGYTVTAATGDKLLVKNSAGTTSVLYSICAGGN